MFRNMVPALTGYSLGVLLEDAALGHVRRVTRGQTLNKDTHYTKRLKLVAYEFLP